MIGGIDVVFWVPENMPASDVILRSVRRHWPGFVFQNAEDPAPLPKTENHWLPEPSGREFFLYKDNDAAISWLENGAVPENLGTVLYVILGNRHQAELGLRSLTLVCG